MVRHCTYQLICNLRTISKVICPSVNSWKDLIQHHIKGVLYSQYSYDVQKANSIWPMNPRSDDHITSCDWLSLPSVTSQSKHGMRPGHGSAY